MSGEPCRHSWRFCQWGDLLPAASPLGPKFLRRYLLRNSLYERGKFGFSDSFHFGDMKAPILRFVLWRCRHLAFLSALRAKSVKACRQTATNPLSKRKPGARGRNFRSKPEPEVVLAAVLDSRSAKCRENAQKRRRNVEIAVPRERASTDVQFGVPAPDRK